MHRIAIATALLLGLAAPAFAQTTPADPARTLDQNQRAYVAPAPAEAAPARPAPARRVTLADRQPR